MTQRTWPAVYGGATLQNITEVLTGVTSTRDEDIQDFQDLPNRFVGGRKVDKVPTGSADYNAATDLIGDRNWDTSYEYLLVDDGAGGAVWRRITLASW